MTRTQGGFLVTAEATSGIGFLEEEYEAIQTTPVKSKQPKTKTETYGDHAAD